MNENMRRVYIYRPSPFGRMYLCADGSLSNNRAEAQEYWSLQFDAVVAENWIVNTPERAQMEAV
jgi:hypothetical protein